jgi:hypothetical protein
VFDRKEKPMTRKSVMIVIVLCAASACGGVLLAQRPPVDVGEKHGNMRAAQQLIQQAWQKIDDAQQDNNYNLGGHAGKAKDFLLKASQEIKESAEAANSHR